VLHVRDTDIDGVRAGAPHARTLKHLIAPWTVGSDAMWVGFSIVDTNSSSNPHEHSNEEIFIVLEGHGRAVVNDEADMISPGSVVRVPPGARHQLINDGTGVLKVACVASPAFTQTDFNIAHELNSR